MIEPADWNVTYAFSLAGITPVPEAFEVKWRVEPRFLDTFESPGVTDAATETLVPLARGLPNVRHTLEIAGDESMPIAGIRIYRPDATANGGN